MLKLIKNFLYNKKYASNSLYGAGIFPFWIYVAFYDMPAYKFARKRGLNKYFSLMVANIPGSLSHVKFFDDGTWDELFWFIFSLILCTTVLYLFHKEYQKMKKTQLEIWNFKLRLKERGENINGFSRNDANI